MAIQYFCQNEQRKRDVIDHPGLNGIDYIEVIDRNIPGDELPQGRLVVHFLNDLTNEFDVDNIRIEGGQRIRNVDVKDVATNDNTLTVDLDNYGDFSTYTLRVIKGAGSFDPPDWLDPILSSIDFLFKVSCPSDFDCEPEAVCQPERLQEPEIDYLAKDYASFRQLMLDRISTIMPKWGERNPSDIGVAAVEVLAYAADYMSYYQDAVATEAYLGTARKRVSVRRHARLLDYSMHDGCNARVWLAMRVGDGANGYILRSGTPFFTGNPERVIVEEKATGSLAEIAQSFEPEAIPELRFFSLFAIEHVSLGENSHVHIGHVGVNLQVDTLFSESNSDNENQWSVEIESNVEIHGQYSRVYGDKIKIAQDAVVRDVYYNNLQNSGSILGTERMPVLLPLNPNLPDIPDFSVGSSDVVVNKNEITTLAPGDYKKLRVKEKGKLKLTGGIYNFLAWDLKEKSKVLAEGTCEIRIKEGIKTGKHVHIRPNNEGSMQTTASLVIYIDDSGEPEDSEIVIGEHAKVVANIYATNSSVVIKEKSHITGTMLGRNINIDKQVQLHAFDEFTPGPLPSPPPRRICITEISSDVEVFETMHDVTLHAGYNCIEFYTWGDDDCCLPTGTTKASLDNGAGNLDYLKAGDLLLFEEIASPTGIREDADLTHHHLVRLTNVELVIDPLYDHSVVNIQWAHEDALPFPLCLKVVKLNNVGEDLCIDEVEQNEVVLRSMSIVRGNIALADHGRSICNGGLKPDTVPQLGRYRPRLENIELTFSTSQTSEELEALPATTLLQQDPRGALPEIELTSDTEIWLAKHDLLNSDRFALEFVIETENDDHTYIRFGDNILGRRPASGSRFIASYRVGNGAAGNVGSETITHLALPPGESDIQKSITVRNPFSAYGGIDPESLEEVKLYAPQAFRKQKRAVTVEDYAEMAQTHPDVQKAVATQRWTGSWHTIFLTIDRKGGRPVDTDFEMEMREFLEPLRVMGHDLEVESPRLVALDIALVVCIGTDHLRSEVKSELFEIFSSGQLTDGSLGFFHPDNWTFGQSVFLSPVVAAAMQVPGVVWVDTERFERWGQVQSTVNQDKIDAVINIGRLEIARLDNAPNAPENGRIEFIMKGGL